MSGVNKVILLGNLGKDPEVKTFDGGAKKATFSLATTESYKNREGQKVEETEWHNVVMWRGLAEIAEKFLKKGSQVYIEGKIKSRSYNDKEGVKRYVTEIITDQLTMIRNDVQPRSVQQVPQENTVDDGVGTSGAYRPDDLF